MEDPAASASPPADDVGDEHWDTFVRLVESGRLRIAPAGTDPRAHAGGGLRRFAKRAAAVLVLALVGGGPGYLIGGWIGAALGCGVLVAGFVWILVAGAPEPFHAAYIRNKALFERSYLSGAVVFIDTRTRELHEYPTEWRRITEELD